MHNLAGFIPDPSRYSMTVMWQKIWEICINYPIMPLATLSPLFLLFYGYLTIKKPDLSIRLILIFAVVYFFSDLVLWVTTGLHIRNVTYFYLREFLLNIALIGAYYYLIGSAEKKRLILMLELLLSTLFILFFFLPSPLYELIVVFKIGLIVTIMLYFHWLVSVNKTRAVTDFPFFWVSSGILLFSFATLLLGLFGKFIIYGTQNVTLTRLFTQFQELMTIIMFLFIGVGFFIYNKNTTLEVDKSAGKLYPRPPFN